MWYFNNCSHCFVFLIRNSSLFLLWVTPSANRNTYSVAIIVGYLTQGSVLSPTTQGYVITTPLPFRGALRHAGDRWFRVAKVAYHPPWATPSLYAHNTPRANTIPPLCAYHQRWTHIISLGACRHRWISRLLTLWAFHLRWICCMLPLCACHPRWICCMLLSGACRLTIASYNSHTTFNLSIIQSYFFCLQEGRWHNNNARSDIHLFTNINCLLSQYK